ncbi:MAG: MbnP family protein [Lewinella sp.]
MQKLLPLFLLLLAGCMDDDDFVEVTEHELTIAFRAEYGGEPLQIQADSYAYPTGDSLKMLLFQYYMSDLSLGVQGPGSHFVINDIDLIRWNSAVDSAEVERTYTFRAPEGQFNGLHFELGVKPELNATDPSNFSADYVLNENEFWGPQTRYVFAKIEANAMLEEDGRFDTGLTYHMGSDSLYRSINLPQAFTLEPGRNSRLTIVVDVRDALSSNGETLDITDPAKQTVHGGNQAVANGVWDRLAGSFRLEVQ